MCARCWRRSIRLGIKTRPHKDRPRGRLRTARRCGTAAHSAAASATRGAGRWPCTPDIEYRIKIAGFGGQGVLLLGQLIAEAGMDDGARGFVAARATARRCGRGLRTAMCGFRRSQSIRRWFRRPNVLIALNEPSLRKFLATVDAGRTGSLQLAIARRLRRDRYHDACACRSRRWPIELGSAKVGQHRGAGRVSGAVTTRCRRRRSIAPWRAW